MRIPPQTPRILPAAAIITALAVVLVGAGTLLLGRHLRDTEIKRAVNEGRQLAVGLSREATEHFWRTREEFIYSLTNLPYHQLFAKREPGPEVTVPIRRFLVLNEDMIRSLVVTSPSGLSRTASLDENNYFSVTPPVSEGLPQAPEGCITLSGVVQAGDGTIEAYVTAILDPVSLWSGLLTTNGPSHPNLWFHLFDQSVHAQVIRQGGVHHASRGELSPAMIERLKIDAREGYEGDLAHTFVHEGRELDFISAYAPSKIETWQGLIMVSADEATVVGAARKALILQAGIAGGVVLLLAALYAMFARNTLRSRQLLDDNRRRLETVFNTVQSGILLAEKQTGRITQANAAALNLLGFKQEDVLDRDIGDILPEISAAANGIETGVRGGSGGARHVLVTSAPLELADSEYQLCSFVDITALRDTADQLRQAVARAEANARAAEAANDAKTSFLSMMSHELRTPLTSILGLTELITERIHGPLTEDQDKYLRLVLQSGRRLLDLINNILQVSKIESAGRDLEPVPSPLRPLCETALEAVRPRAEKHGLALEADLPDPAFESRVDACRLLQILEALLDNAAKFTPSGTIGLRVSHDAREVRFTVWDRGIGIPAKDHERIFTPFVQLDTRLAREYGGTGLGLPLVRQLVTAHGGRIELESTPGAGSSFTVVLPR